MRGQCLWEGVEKSKRRTGLIMSRVKKKRMEEERSTALMELFILKNSSYEKWGP